MKTKATIFLSVLALGINIANATVHIITAIGNNDGTEAFIPNVTNAVCGDTIKFVQGNGTQQHTAVSTSVPAGANSFSSGTLTASGFIYVVKKAGTYNYTCHPSGTNPAGHMPGSIEVTCTNGIASIDADHISYAYPDPFSSTIIIEAKNADKVILYDVLGREVKSVLFERGQEKVQIDASDLRKGIYFYSIVKDGAICETRKLVKNG